MNPKRSRNWYQIHHYWLFKIDKRCSGAHFVSFLFYYYCTFYVSKSVIWWGARRQGYFSIFQCLLNISEVPQFPHFVTLIVIRYHTDNQHLITLMTPETWTQMMYSVFRINLVVIIIVFIKIYTVRAPL